MNLKHTKYIYIYIYISHKLKSNHFIWLKSKLLPLLYFDLRPGQTCHSKDSGSDTSQWPLIERNHAGELSR